MDPARRDAIVRSGAVEVKHPDLRPDEVLVFVTDDQLGDLQNEPNVALIYPAWVELIQGVPVHSLQLRRNPSWWVIRDECGEGLGRRYHPSDVLRSSVYA